jgi:hypothetical protein
VFRAVRRFVVPALVGLFGLVLGLTIGFAVGLYQRAGDPAWLEAIGTWVGAGVTLLAVILAGIVSEEFARRREHSRELEAANQARQVEWAKLQQQADLVACDVFYTSSSPTPEPNVVRVNAMLVEVQNNSSQPIWNVFCRVPQMGDEPIKLSDVLQPRMAPVRQEISVKNPFTVYEDHRQLHTRATFTFFLGGVEWLGRYALPAQRRDPPAQSNLRSIE